MRFDDFMAAIDNLRVMSGPGITAHELIFPNISKLRAEALSHDPNPKKSAVAAIVFPTGTVASLILIERQTYDGAHSGQISLPGGKMDAEDPDLETTARRETQEEIGIPGESLRLIRSLSQVYIPRSKHLVQPFIFSLSFTPKLELEEREVKDAIVMPLSQLLNDSIMIEGEIELDEGVRLKTIYFNYADRKIWGATAMMLSELKILLRQL